MSRFAKARFSNARFATVVAVVLALLTSGVVAGAAGQALVIGFANQGGVSNTSLDTTSSGFAWQMYQHGTGVGVFAISDNGVALAGLAHNGNEYGLSVTNDGAAGTGAAIIADGKNNTALDLRVNSSSVPPLKVNSSGFVTNLNADFVDGLHGNSLTRVAFNSDDDAALVGPASGTVIGTSITAPMRGFLTITASSDVFGSSAGGVTCNLDVDGGDINASHRFLSLATGNFEEDCSTNAGYATCGGTHTVSLEGFVGAGQQFDEATIEVQFTPYNGAGNLRPILGCLIIPLDDPAYDPTNNLPE